MCGLTIALVICILVAGVMYTDCDHLPGFGVKDGCKHPHPAHHGGGSASDGEGGFFDEDYASDGGDGGAGWVGPQPSYGLRRSVDLVVQGLTPRTVKCSACCSARRLFCHSSAR